MNHAEQGILATTAARDREASAPAGAVGANAMGPVYRSQWFAGGGNPTRETIVDKLTISPT